MTQLLRARNVETEFVSEWEVLAPAEATAAGAPAARGLKLIGCLRAPSRKLRGRELPYLTRPPLPHDSRECCGVNNLYYLMYLNVFQRLFEHAIRETLFERKRCLCATTSRRPAAVPTTPLS
jgi:hypothetical protein